MKFAAALTVLIIICLAYKMLSGDSYSADFKNAVNKQPMSFTVPNEKAAVVWNRAPEYLQKMKHLITGGPMQQNDTVVHIPYIPGLSYNRGNSIRIIRRAYTDSTAFFTEWFYYDEPDSFSAKELAYYMLTGIDRYDK